MWFKKLRRWRTAVKESRYALFLFSLAILTVAAITVAATQSASLSPSSKHWTLIAVLGLAAVLIAAGFVVAIYGWRRWLDTLARSYFRLRAWNRTLFDLALSAVVATPVRLFIVGSQFRPSLAAEVGLDILIYLGGLIFVFEVHRLGRTRLFRRVDAITALAQGPARTAIIAVLEQHLDKLKQTVEGVQTASGKKMNRAEITTWTEICFEHGAYCYDGADSNVPSRYYDIYPTFLTSHEKMLTKAGIETGKRILIATPEELRSDRHHHPDSYREFLLWHSRHNVPLDYIPPNEANRLRGAHGLPTADVGVWRNQYALLFEPDRETGDVAVSMRFPGDAEYTQCESYLQAVRDAARPVDDVVPLFPRPMALAWPDYVDPPRRLETLGPFLEKVLQPYGRDARILDAAAGMGTDSLWLLEHGYFDVTSNEIEPDFAELLERNFTAAGFTGPQLITTDWRDLRRSYPLPVFHVILVLGNSLCLVDDADDQRDCVQQFFEVLRPGGVLVVDERNWDYLLRERSWILENPIENFQHPRVMYEGSGVRSCPVSISRDEIVLLFYKNPHGVRTVEEARSPEHFIGTIDIYPILEPRLPELLSSCGFGEIATFADLEPVEGTPNDATFLTYVAHKPA